MCFFSFCIQQKKAFEEDRASWLKNQFLNMTPFIDRRRCSSSDGQSALSISKSMRFTNKLCIDTAYKLLTGKQGLFRLIQ